MRRLIRFIRSPEIVGNEDCPLMRRWTVLNAFGIKLLVHHFPPNGDDPDPHDHPRSFVTLILRGGYNDMVPCDSPHEPWPKSACALCIHNRGMKVHERMRPGMIRFRRAEHCHITSVGSDGCWSIVVMGRMRRPWGFLWDGEWWPWREYLDSDRAEAATRCPE